MLGYHIAASYVLYHLHNFAQGALLVIGSKYVISQESGNAS